MEEILLILGNLIILSFIVAKKNLGSFQPRAILALCHLNLWYYFSLKTPSDLLWFINIIFIILNYYPWKWKKSSTLKNKLKNVSTRKIINEKYIFFDQASLSSKENLKKRYNFLMKRYHPDRTLALSLEEQNNAAKIAIEINILYKDLLKKNQFHSSVSDFQ